MRDTTFQHHTADKVILSHLDGRKQYCLDEAGTLGVLCVRKFQCCLFTRCVGRAEDVNIAVYVLSRYWNSPKSMSCRFWRTMWLSLQKLITILKVSHRLSGISLVFLILWLPRLPELLAHQACAPNLSTYWSAHRLSRSRHRFHLAERPVFWPSLSPSQDL